MTCHISLAQALLGLNGQTDTEKYQHKDVEDEDTLAQEQVHMWIHANNMNDSNHVQKLGPVRAHLEYISPTPVSS